MTITHTNNSSNLSGNNNNVCDCWWWWRRRQMPIKFVWERQANSEKRNKEKNGAHILAELRQFQLICFFCFGFGFAFRFLGFRVHTCQERTWLSLSPHLRCPFSVRSLDAVLLFNSVWNAWIKRFDVCAVVHTISINSDFYLRFISNHFDWFAPMKGFIAK